jgi:hypothetical protein
LEIHVLDCQLTWIILLRLVDIYPTENGVVETHTPEGSKTAQENPLLPQYYKILCLDYDYVTHALALGLAALAIFL